MFKIKLKLNNMCNFKTNNSAIFLNKRYRHRYRQHNTIGVFQIHLAFLAWIAQLINSSTILYTKNVCALWLFPDWVIIFFLLLYFCIFYWFRKVKVYNLFFWRSFIYLLNFNHNKAIMFSNVSFMMALYKHSYFIIH